MEKIFYDNWLAKIILFTCDTITLGPFVLTKQKSLSQYTINHECTHARQWCECMLASGVLIWALVLFANISAWWFALSFLSFYILYVLEWIIKLPFYRSKAYRNISFEREAYACQNDNSYLENGDYFEWIHRIIK